MLKYTVLPRLGWSKPALCQAMAKMLTFTTKAVNGSRQQIDNVAVTRSNSFRAGAFQG